ncbi:MAG: VOC family protein [Bacteroidales bacterium]
MKFCWSTLRVKDLETSIKFYEEIIGLSVNNRFKAGSDIEIAFLGDGETKVELIYDKNGGDINVGPDISWGFEVDSLDDMMQLVKEKGISIESGPFQPSPHTRFFFIKDPNGMKIQLVEQM